VEIEEVRAVLRKITILAGLTEQQLCSVLELLDKVTYQTGEHIFEQGQQPSHIYIIKSGRIKLIAQEDDTNLELIVFEQGKCFGESSIIGIQPHAATAIAIEPSELMVLSRNALLSLYKTDLELFSILILNIAREACRRLHSTDEVLLHYVLRR
jgi:CRP/FNR family cyclic AMP-dependent transcriptional regulator